MKFTKLTNIKLSFFLLVITSILAACSGGSMEGRILVSEVPQNDFFDLTPWNLSEMEGARIVTVLPGNEKDTKNLTGGFFSAVSPSVSDDGENMLFAGKKEATDHWQIWEMNLSSGKARQITNEETDCIDPSYLPIGRIGFTKLVNNDKFSCNMIFTSNLDGTNLQQVTFSPQTFAAITTLKDGRFLSMEKQVYPEQGKQKLMVMRPDGTKLEFFYKSADGFCILSKPVETENEEIIFIEKDEMGTQISSLSYNVPLHSHKILSEGTNGDFSFVGNYLDGKLITGFRKNENENFGLCEFEPENKSINEIYKSEGYQVVDAVLVKAYQRPKNLPSEVQLQEKAGLMMCQDINFYGIESLYNEHPMGKAAKIEVIGIDSTLGIVDVEEDGSFYLKVEADMPFRIQTLNANNEVVSGPGSWYYVRPNERRACVGCHTGPEIAPFNRQPLSVRKDPAIIKNNSEVKLKANMKDYEH